MKCSFCNKVIEAGSGMTIIDKTGKILRFDTKKCEKNMMKLGRDPRKFKWAQPEKK